MWPLVFAAIRRPLTAQEKAEVRRLAEILARGIPGRPSFNVDAEGLSRDVLSSRIFEDTPDPTDLDGLLGQIDALRGKLDPVA